MLSQARENAQLVKSPHLPKALHPNLFRAMVILILSSSCAIPIEKKPVVAGLNNPHNIPLPNDDTNTRINEEIHYFDKYAGSEGVLNLINRKLSHPVPTNIINQLIQITYVSYGKSLLTEKNGCLSGPMTNDTDVYITPIEKPSGECHIEEVTLKDNFGSIRKWPNIHILESVLLDLGPVSVYSDVVQKHSGVTRNNKLKNKGKAFIGKIYSYSRTLNGYKIKRTSKGVELTVQVAECEKQRKRKAANIASEVRGKLSRGSKKSNR